MNYRSFLRISRLGITAFFSCIMILIIVKPAKAQNTEARLDKLSLHIEGEWSRRIEQDKAIYDDYNLTGKMRHAVILYHFQKADDPKTFFSKAYTSIWPEAGATPRARRFYTSDGDMIWSSGAEITNSLGKGYGQLYVFTKPEGYQSVLVWLENFDTYRKTQNQWNMMMQDAKFR